MNEIKIDVSCDSHLPKQMPGVQNLSAPKTALKQKIVLQPLRHKALRRRQILLRYRKLHRKLSAKLPSFWIHLLRKTL